MECTEREYSGFDCTEWELTVKEWAGSSVLDESVLDGGVFKEYFIGVY